NVLQQVIEVGAIRAGKLGTHFAAEVEQRVTLRADAVKSGPSGWSVTRERTPGAVNVPVFPDLGLLVFGGVAHDPPNLCYSLVKSGVVEVPQLPHQVSGEVFDGHGSLFHCGKQFIGITDPTSQRVQRIPTLNTGEAGIDLQNRRGRLGLVVGGKTT